VGLIARQITVVPPNNPPEWTSTPSIMFQPGVGGTYALDQDTFDQEGDTLTYVRTAGTFPTGVTMDTAGLITATTAVVAGTTTGFTVTIDDGTASPVASPTFSIVIASGFTAHNPTNYVSRFTGGAGYGLESRFGTVSVADNGNFVEIRIQVVNTLSDGTAAGTERFALTNSIGGQMVVVYDEAGWRIASSITSGIRDDMTVARQTAPGKGFFSRGNGNNNTGINASGTSNILWWHYGHAFGGPNNGGTNDSFQFNNSNNHVFVNCAFWFGGDETFSAESTNDCTIYNTMISHCLINSVGAHNFGSILGRFSNLSIYRSGYYHHKLRGPRANPEDASGVGFLDLANTLTYNMGPAHNTITSENTVTHPGSNFRRCLYIEGPDNQSGVHLRFASSGGSWVGASKVFTGDHIFDGGANLSTTSRFNLAGDAIVFEGSEITAAIPNGVNATTIDTLSNIDALNLIQENLGPRPLDPLAYFTEVKGNAVNAVNNVAGQGSWAAETPSATYTGDGSGFDDIPSVSTDNIADLDAFLSANFTLGVDYTVENVGDGTFKIYTFLVTNGLCPCDDWLNTKNGEVMIAGWEV